MAEVPTVHPAASPAKKRPDSDAPRFVYLGPESTFAEQALLTIPAAQKGARTPMRSVPEALDAVRAGEADAALVPWENSVGGAVGVSLDEAIDGDPLVITRDVVIPVEFVLAAAPGMMLGDVRSIAAHPQASAQCRGWLRSHAPDAAVIDVLSNGAAAAAVSKGEHDAAICAPIAIERFGLNRLADKIADHPDAVTRFVLLSRPGPPAEPTGDDLTSLAIWISHDRVGALLAVLTELAVRGVNLTRIESRPTGEKLGRYVFVLECTGHVAEARVGEALQGLRRACAHIRFLGSYPRAAVPSTAAEKPVPPPPGLSDSDYADSAAWLRNLRRGEAG
jgi:prephenate dehydratase